MAERFFVTPPIAGERAALADDEARHLTSVMRAKVGDEVVLFDGSGTEFAARITSLHKHAVELTILERREISRELAFDLTLAVALPKGERQKWLIEKVTELGVRRFVPLITERGVAQPTEAALDRLRRAVIEASKQCGRNRLMEIGEPRSASECFAQGSAEAIRIVADSSGESLAAQPWFAARAAATPVIAAVGPEGGFSKEEVAAALAVGWKPVSLGSRILRVETAAIALAAWAASQ